MEWELIQHGFDYCYDKRLYEHLISFNVESVKNHLKSDLDYQKKLLRFIENHDEPRAISTFGPEASKAAAVVAYTLPGASLIFEGQTYGSKIRLPVQLGRGPVEEKEENIMKFYDKLLRVFPGRGFKEAEWSMCRTELIDQNDDTYNNIIAYQWLFEDQMLLIAVNYSSISSKAHIRTNNINYGVSSWRFTDLLGEGEYIYKGEDIDKHGLYIELDSWRSHIFHVMEA